MPLVDNLGQEAVEVVVSLPGREGEVWNQHFVHTHGCVLGHHLTELCWGTNQARPVAHLLLKFGSLLFGLGEEKHSHRGLLNLGRITPHILAMPLQDTDLVVYFLRRSPTIPLGSEPGHGSQRPLLAPTSYEKR